MVRPRPAHDRWYKTSRWQKLRAFHLAMEPLCVMCEREGRVTAATVADHIRPHRGNPALFWDSNNLQSLCPPHHNGDKQRIERGGKPKPRFDASGWPIE